MTFNEQDLYLEKETEIEACIVKYQDTIMNMKQVPLQVVKRNGTCFMILANARVETAVRGVK